MEENGEAGSERGRSAPPPRAPGHPSRPRDVRSVRSVRGSVCSVHGAASPAAAQGPTRRPRTPRALPPGPQTLVGSRLCAPRPRPGGDALWGQTDSSEVRGCTPQAHCALGEGMSPRVPRTRDAERFLFFTFSCFLKFV